MLGILVEKNDGRYHALLQPIGDDRLQDGNVLVRVLWSSFNYKDGLAITGKSPVIRNFPMVPGIDFAGLVEESSDARFGVGDDVILTGFGMGETHWGGYAEKARVNADWLLQRPSQLSLRQTMAIGTAGFTAMLCVMALQQHGVKPDQGEILVTGATGGVGSLATLILSNLGYDVVAISGRPELHPLLIEVGAKEILPRSPFSEPGKALGKERWAGAVDVVGSHTLANVCASTKYGGVVTACGLAGGLDFPATVAPFILRGVTLVGIDSVMCPMATREIAWKRLANEVQLEKLEGITNQISLDEIIPFATDSQSRQHFGRTVVAVAND